MTLRNVCCSAFILFCGGVLIIGGMRLSPYQVVLQPQEAPTSQDAAAPPTKQQPLRPLVSEQQVEQKSSRWKELLTKIEVEQKVSDAALDAKAQIAALESQLQQVRLEKQQSLDALKLAKSDAQEIQNQVQSLEARKAEGRPVHCHNFRYMILWSCYFKRHLDLGKHFTGFEQAQQHVYTNGQKEGRRRDCSCSYEDAVKLGQWRVSSPEGVLEPAENSNQKQQLFFAPSKLKSFSKELQLQILKENAAMLFNDPDSYVQEAF